MEDGCLYEEQIEVHFYCCAVSYVTPSEISVPLIVGIVYSSREYERTKRDGETKKPVVNPRRLRILHREGS